MNSPKRRNDVRDSLGHEPQALGLVPPSQAPRIANAFLAWYLVGSVVWILASDELLQMATRFVEIPSWIHSAKGIAYVTLFGLALRRAARGYVEGLERAHAAHIEAKLDLVQRLALAAEYRDDATGGHNARIGRFAAIVGRELGLADGTCEALGCAATLHDLGKIGVPDSLLLKQGAFTNEERQAMECHTTLGAEILAGSQHPLVTMAHSIALTHHECWNGTGYPNRLAETEIPLEGRIVAVCDVFDALTNDRPYKKAWRVDDAVAEIVRGRGTHFDPAVVEAFLCCLPQIEAIQRELGTHRTDSAGSIRLAA